MRAYVRAYARADKSSEKGERAVVVEEEEEEARGRLGPDEQIRMQCANYECRADKIGNERAYKARTKAKGEPR